MFKIIENEKDASRHPFHLPRQTYESNSILIAFIDTEVSVQSRQINDFGAVRQDGAVLHTRSYDEFLSFIANCTVLCGHNVIRHDLQYLSKLGQSPTLLTDRYLIIDTLFLSPLLFPKKPYHRLVKDDKLQSDQINNPANDALKARDLFNDEVAAWHQLPAARQTILFHLLKDIQEFSGFFQYLGVNPPDCDIVQLIAREYEGKICSHANISAVVKHYPVELAYALAIIGADDMKSHTPAWVTRNYPRVANVMNLLCNTPCSGCPYCQQRLDAHQGLKEFFGYDRFRTFDGIPMQQQAVESAIRGESLLTIFPTGGGKSLTFQLPALMAGRNIHGLTVVISPLQSLMKDQVDNLAERGIADAVTINGLLDPIERAAAIAQVADGTANLLYIAHEMLRSKTIERLLMGRTIARFVIDEAHCFSAWGHDFRVDYLFIGDFIKQLQEAKQQRFPIPVSCFTATAKQKVISDIVDYFNQKLNLSLRVFAASSERKNLRYSVIHTDTPNDKYNQLRNIILGRTCPTIVYVSRTRKTHELCQRLRADGIMALPFNGRMDAEAKVKNQNAFMRGEARVIVATSAFGMGVDKKDVGLVIHYDISDSLENYVQEAGRAGRDPEMEAECYVLYSDTDLDKHFILLNQTKLSISEIQQVWQAIKELTPTQKSLSCSPLEIARQAGWGEETIDIETRVKAAISALERAGFVERSNNVPHVFATGITVGNMDEARRRLTLSPFFDENNREEAARIIRSLISCRATSGNSDGEAESRIDYLADMLGMSKETVIRNVNLMRQEGLLADSHDMQAWITKTTTGKELEQTLRLEHFLLSQLNDGTTILHYKEINEAAINAGIANSTVRRIKTLLYFLSLKGYLRKEEHTAADLVNIELLSDTQTIMARFDKRMELCRFVVRELTMAIQETNRQSQLSGGQGDVERKSLVNFSEVELLNRYQSTSQQLQFGNREEVTLTDMDETLLYLSKTSLLKIAGGFLVIYNTMQLKRKLERRARYGKEQYRLLDEFYKQRIQQIHIVGEFARMMVSDYDAALQFVKDYFQMDFRKFISKYFKGERKTEINNNITPAKYKQLFGSLDDCQQNIINDKVSKYIVVAAGPGSGKTRVLVHKLASLLLLEDVKHEQMLMLTFSRSAATEFKKRLMELIGNAAHYVDIKTFHSFSFDLLGRPGNLDDAGSVVLKAATMIENGEVEESKIAKSVLVIDEAQDMGNDESRLLLSLMRRNEDMRVIAVGDDDQNIYQFRGSDSAHLRSLVSDHGATLYEMTTNYRSAGSIVSLANRFATLLPNRMKQTPCKPSRKENGTTRLHLYSNTGFLPLVVEQIAKSGVHGSTCLLTTTNDDAMQAVFLLEQQGVRARLIQSLNGFRFSQLAEVRYFLKQLNTKAATAEGNGTESVIPRRLWNEAKENTMNAYATSSCLDILKAFFTDFEATHRILYRSDLREYLFESNIEDFFSANTSSVTVSTIHKAKGREFDTVYLLFPGSGELTEEQLHTLYVAITRAQNNLQIHTNIPLFNAFDIPTTTHPDQPLPPQPLRIALSLRDIYLDYCKEHKADILRLRSGAPLLYSKGYLLAPGISPVACLSTSMQQTLGKLEARGYRVSAAEISYIVAWHPRDEEQEFAICLANLTLVV